MSLLITWAITALSMFIASMMLSKMKIEGGVWNHLVVSGLFGVLMVVTGWFFYFVLGVASAGLLVAFSFLGKLLTGAIVLKLTSMFSERLTIKGFGTPILAALIMSVSGTVAELVLKSIG